MHKPTTRPRLGALTVPGEPRDRFTLAEVVGRRSARSGRLLTDPAGVEWGGR